MKKITLILLILTNSFTYSQNKALIKETFFNQPSDKIDSIAINNGLKSGAVFLIRAFFKTDSDGNVFEISVVDKSKIFESEINSIINQIPGLNPNEYLHKGQEMNYGLKIYIKLASNNQRKTRIKNGKINKIAYYAFHIKEYFPVKFIQIDEIEKNEFSKIGSAPVTEKCKNIIDEIELRNCVSYDLSSHINSKFDADLASELGLPPGLQKIIIKFIISKSGEIVNIEAEANHEELREEGIRIVNIFPNFIKPATIDGKPVDVKYSMPIMFKIE
jgi:hypothetical protein